MKKQIKKYGNTLVVSFSKEEVESNKIKLNDIVEVTFPDKVPDKIQDMSDVLIKNNKKFNGN